LGRALSTTVVFAVERNGECLIDCELAAAQLHACGHGHQVKFGLSLCKSSE
jgi:hypothetical protein